MIPFWSTRRIRLFVVSAIKRFPFPSKLMSSTEMNVAAVAGPPSPEKPGSPVPATVEITPAFDVPLPPPQPAATRTIATEVRKS
jgi:hypothetical protein